MTDTLKVETCCLCRGSGWFLLTGMGGGLGTCPDCNGTGKGCGLCPEDCKEKCVYAGHNQPPVVDHELSASLVVDQKPDYLTDNGPNEGNCALCDGRGFYGIPGGRCTFCDGTGKVKWRSSTKHPS